MKDKFLKRFMGLACAVVMVLGVAFAGVNAASGSGTDSEGYTMITTAAQLDAVRNNVSGKYRLYADIDLTGYESGKTTAKKGWYPIGYGNHFKGEFDGNGYTVKGLWSNQGIGYTGLFSVTIGATIKNLNIELADAGITGIYEIGALVGNARNGTVIDNVHVKGGSIKVTGGGYAGGLVGHSYGSPRVTIKNSTVTDTTTSTSGNYSGGFVGVAEKTDISNCHTINTTSTGYSYVGGFVGGLKSQSEISKCMATGSATGKASYIGGFAGVVYEASNLSDAYAYGDANANHYAGGLIGTIYGKSTVYRSCAYGNATAKNYIAGGLIGEVIDANLSNTYARGDVSGTTGVGGLVGYFSACGSKSVENSYSAGKVTGKGTTEYGSFSGHTAVQFLGRNYYDQQTSGVASAHGTAGSRSGPASAYPQGRDTNVMMQRATFPGWDFSSIWRIDENESYPYFEETIPALTLDVQGNLKENRKFTITGAYTDGDLISVRDTQITVTPVGGGASADAVKIDADVSTNVYKELIIKEAGEYEVAVTIKYLTGTKTVTQNITIAEDQAPTAEISAFSVGPYNPMMGYAAVTKSFTANSPDGDDCKVEWLVYYDADFSGDFSDDELTIYENDMRIISEMGDYQVKLRVTESYSDTILKFIDPATDYLSAETDFIAFTVE